MRILVAEDDAGSREVLGRVLEKMGHEVALACDGDQAWHIQQQSNFPIIISDWQMPGLSGVELCEKVREAAAPGAYTYFILLTGLSSRDAFLEAMEKGADDFMVKPFDRAVIAARLSVAERILNLKTEVQQLRGLLPTCCYCKKIREGESNWMAMEAYIEARSPVNFSHGICPDCYTRHVDGVAATSPST